MNERRQSDDKKPTKNPIGPGESLQLIKLNLLSNSLTILPDSIGGLAPLTELYSLYSIRNPARLTKLPDSIGNLGIPTKHKKPRFRGKRAAREEDEGSHELIEKEKSHRPNDRYHSHNFL